MGMFSWSCLACGFSLRECRGCSEDNWMAHGVALTPNGTRAVGYYNGYGQLGDTYNLGQQMGHFSVYHKACWELVGKPEFTKQSGGARDQGACHAMHGQPFPKPTLEWLEKARAWHALEAVLDGWSNLRADLELDAVEKLFATLDTDAQARSLDAYRAQEEARHEARNALREAYYSNPDLDALEPKYPEAPATFEFEGKTFDHGWFGVLVARDDNRRMDEERAARRAAKP